MHPHDFLVFLNESSVNLGLHGINGISFLYCLFQLGLCALV